LNNGHILFTDNAGTAFGSVFIIEWHCIGRSVRPNRKSFSKVLASESLGKGEAEFLYTQNQGVTAVKYRAMKDKAQNREHCERLITYCDICMVSAHGMRISAIL